MYELILFFILTYASVMSHFFGPVLSKKIGLPQWDAYQYIPTEQDWIMVHYSNEAKKNLASIKKKPNQKKPIFEIKK